MQTRNLKIARQKKGLSQTQLAEMVGTKKQSICNWEKGRSMPSYLKLTKLSEILDESIDYLLQTNFTTNPEESQYTF